MPITPPTPFYPGVPQQYPSQVSGNVVLQPTFVLQTPQPDRLSQNPVAQDPTQPWMDREFASQLPVVPVGRPVRYNSVCPAFGFDETFNISDTNSIFASVKSNPIQNVTVDTQSAVIKIGCGRLDISATFSSPAATCTISVYQVDSVNGNVLIKQYDGVNRYNAGSLFVGGHDQIMLNGADIVIGVTNITNGAAVSVVIQGH